MRVIDPGHIYVLEELDKNSEGPLILPFVKRIGDRYPGNRGVAHGGTYCQEVLRAVIDRCKYLNNQIECPQTPRIIELLRSALYLFEYRAAEIKGKKIEFFKMPNIRSDLENIENISTCKKCGHIYPHSHMEDE